MPAVVLPAASLQFERHDHQARRALAWPTHAAAALPTLANSGGPSLFEGLGDIAQLDSETDFATGNERGGRGG